MGADAQKSTGKRCLGRGGRAQAKDGSRTPGAATPEGIDGLAPGTEVKSPDPNRPSGQTESGLPKGYNCKKCGRCHEYSLWVFAHWHEDLVHTCDGCGQSHIIRRGIARKGR